MPSFRCATISLALLAFASSAAARRIICIDGTGDETMNVAEGHYRANPQADDKLTVGGDLATCLGAADTGDIVILVAHGGPGTFTWGGTTYAGFGSATGGGTAVEKLPVFTVPGALGKASGIQVWCCYSTATPTGNNVGRGAASVAQSLISALPRGGPGVSGTGRKGKVSVVVNYRGGGLAEENAAKVCMKDKAKAAGYDDVARWIASMSPTTAGTTANQTVNATNCPGTSGMITVALDYTAPRDPSGSPFADDTTAEVFTCSHGCAVSGAIRGATRRAKFAARCDDRLLETTPGGALPGACRSLERESIDEGCATPHVSELIALAYGPNDFSGDPEDGTMASPASLPERRCQRAIGIDVAKGLRTWLRACSKGRPGTVGPRFGGRILRVCEGVDPIRDPLTGTVIPGVDSPCGPLDPGTPISAASLRACLASQVGLAGVAACPVASPSGAFVDSPGGPARPAVGRR